MRSVAHLFWFVVSVGIIVGLVWLARRIDPLSSRPDGSAFEARLQEIARSGEPGDERRVRALIEGNRVIVFERAVHQSDVGLQMFLAGRSPDPPRGWSVYLLSDDGAMFAMSVKRGSPPDRRLAGLL